MSDPLPPSVGKGVSFWRLPDVAYSYPAAIDAAGTVAAPLLAGFAITLAALVITSPGDLLLPDLTLTLLVSSAIALLAALQCAFWARQYVVTPSQIIEWWPQLREPSADNKALWDQLRQEQWAHHGLMKLWSRRMNITYNAGIVLLLAALLVLLIPRSSITILRVVAIVAAAGAIAGELFWIFGQSTRLFPKLRDAVKKPENQPYVAKEPDPPPHSS